MATARPDEGGVSGMQLERVPDRKAQAEMGVEKERLFRGGRDIPLLLDVEDLIEEERGLVDRCRHGEGAEFRDVHCGMVSFFEARAEHAPVDVFYKRLGIFAWPIKRSPRVLGAAERLGWALAAFSWLRYCAAFWAFFPFPAFLGAASVDEASAIGCAGAASVMVTGFFAFFAIGCISMDGYVVSKRTRLRGFSQSGGGKSDSLMSCG